MNVVYFADGLGPSIATTLSQSAGKTKLFLRGFGKSGLEAIKAGKALGSVDRQPFFEIFYSFQALYWYTTNWQIPSPTIIQQFVINQDNVDHYLKSPYTRAGYLA
jgi:hypothetical protein